MEINYGNISNDNQEQMEIGELGLDIWKNYMIKHLSDDLVKQILEEIRAQRLGVDNNSKNNEIINGVIQSFVTTENYHKRQNLNLYQEIFEAPMLAASGEYYRSQAAELLQRCTVSQYMEEVIKKLEEEHRRATKFLHIR